MMKKIMLSLICIFCIVNGPKAQDYTKDVQSVDAVIKALYEVISGEADAPRNWERFRFLFAKDARLVPTVYNADSTNFTYRMLTPEEYITRFSSRKMGFFEWEISRKTEEYGTICHVFTTYATKFTKDGEITNRGINSIQLLKDKNRYYILHIFWGAENLGFKLPAKYLN